MKRKDSKKLILPIAVIGLTFLVMGATYAWLTLTLEGTKEQVIQSGTLALILDDSTSTGITLDKAVPTIEEVAMKKEGYTFTLENTGDIDSKYTIYLDDLPLLDSEIRLEDKYIRYNLQNDQGLNKTRLFSNLKASPNRVLDSGVITPGEKYTYTLRIWLDYDADNGAMGKTFKGKIRVEAQQDIEYLPATLISTTLSNETDTTIGQFWDYKANITKVVLQNEKKKPSGIVQEWDVSTTSDGTVMAYLTGEEAAGYTLYLQANGPIQANADSSWLFQKFTRLQTIEGLENLDTSQVIDMYSMFENCTSLTTLNLSSFDTSKVRGMERLFLECSSLIALNLSSFNTSNVTTMQSMFTYCFQLLALDLSHFDTAKVTDMGYMFFRCRALITLDVSHFDTSNVTIMRYMFNGCSNLVALDLSHFDTSKVTDMSGMFYVCSNLATLDISNFNTTNVTDMSSMFNGCSSLTSLDISNFNTTNVTIMRYMFSNCSSLISLDLSNFDTSRVVNMEEMFLNCSSLTSLDLSSFNTSDVGTMRSMFENCTSLTTLDLSNFSIVNVTSSAYMFYNIKNTAQILVKDVATQTWVIAQKSDFSTSNVLIATA